MTGEEALDVLLHIPTAAVIWYGFMRLERAVGAQITAWRARRDERNRHRPETF